MKNNLGKLEKIKELRTIWPNEAYDFTRWLAEEENLELLGEEIGIDIELIEIEAKSGRYNADILAQDTVTTKKIIIENQLEATNHDHLGKIITYASVQDAQTIIWIVKDVREEHRQAIDWLNEHTDDTLNIFLLKVELWKIGDSPIAPKFDIVSKPNSWTKTIKSGQNKELTETKLSQYDFWESTRKYISENSKILTARQAKPQHWYNLAIGSSAAHISFSINTKESEIACELYISRKKELYNFLYLMKEETEKEIGSTLVWLPLEDKIASRIKIIKEFNLLDNNNNNNWVEAQKWLIEQGEKFYKVFSKRIYKFKNK